MLTDRAGSLTALLTAALFAIPAIWIGGESDGVRGGTVMALAVVLVAACFGRAAYTGRLPRPFNGSPAIFLLALFALLAGLSVGWSLLPGVSYFDAIRMVGYTTVLAGGALAAQLLQDRAREIAIGVALGALVISSYALLSRVLPGIYPASDAFARVRLPFYYWNAVGGVAAIAFVAVLWTGVQRQGPRWLEAASYPAGMISLVVMLLSQSRGALIALVVAVGVWLFFVPRRLRTCGWLLAVGSVSAIVVTWAFSRPAFSTDAVDFATRKSSGLALGLILLVSVALLATFGWIIAGERVRRTLSPTQRVRVGSGVAIGAAAAVVLMVFAIALTNERGFATFKDRVDQTLTGGTAAPANSPSRLADGNSLRGRYWSDAMEIFGAHKLRGTGSDTFSVSRLPFRSDFVEVKHAHGFIPQVMADLGWLGLITVLLLFGVWGFYALRLLGMRKAPTWKWLEDVDDKRTAELSLLAVVVVFGAQSALDWTWFIPGVAIFGIACAGWVAGTPTAHGQNVVEFADGGSKMRLWRAIAIGVLGLLLAFAVYQPVRAKKDVDEGYAVVDTDPARALELGEDAHKIDPASADPMFLIAIAQNNMKDPEAAEATLVRIAIEQPGNIDTWLQLAQFRLNTLDDPKGAIAALRPLLYQNPTSVLGNSLLATARDRRTEQLIDAAADRERRRIERELKRIERQIE